jgi:purine-binding chemotaxis protein CheW
MMSRSSKPEAYFEPDRRKPVVERVCDRELVNKAYLILCRFLQEEVSTRRRPEGDFEMEKQLVVFELTDEFYGVDIAAVESIIKMQAVTKLPHAPDFVEGVTNLRGKVLPVIDLNKRFGLPRQSPGKDGRIIVVSIEGIQVGMIVDSVSEVLTLSEQVVEPTPTIATSVDSTFITGIAKLEDRLVILLDLKKVLSREEQVELQIQ